VETGQVQDDVIQMGQKLLNNSDYKNILTDNSTQYANINRLLADAYFMQENYGLAQEYYKAAVQVDATDIDSYCSLAIAQIRNGQLDDAQETINEIQSRLTANDPYILLVQAELTQKQGKTEDAIQAYTDLVEETVKTGQEEVCYRAALECAELLENKKDYESEIALFNQAIQVVTGSSRYVIYRKLGWAYQASGESVQNSDAYYNKSITYYQLLVESDSGTFDDGYNLGVLYEKTKQYQKAEAEFEKLCTDYPENYKVYMRWAYTELEYQQAQNRQDYSNFLKYYQRALDLYQDVQIKGQSDVEMEQLIQWKAQLQN
jgi:serine/threonine-protein kinase